MKIPALFCLVFVATVGYGQVEVLRKQFFFETDKYQIEPSHQLVLDSIWGLLDGPSLEIKRINIVASADSDADSLYNISLSEKRATTIKDWFTAKGVEEKLVFVQIFGEDKPIAPNNSEENKMKNRRADLEVVFHRKSKTDPTKNSNQPPPKVVEPNIAKNAKPEKCKGDTMIVLPQGTRILINRCDYEQMNGGLQVGEYLTPDAIRVSDMNTMTDNGSALASFGMLCFDFSNLQKLRKPIKVRIPVSSCYDGVMPSLWSKTSNGFWGGEKRKAVKLVTIDKVKYFEFTIDQPGCVNLDIKIRSKTWKFVAEDSLRLVQVRVSYDCPPGVYVQSSKNADGQRKLKLKARCNSENVQVQIIAKDAAGNTMTMAYQPLENLEDSRMTLGCPEKTLFKAIPIKWGRLRSTNFVQQSDFRQTTEK